jgi:TolB-like protein
MESQRHCAAGSNTSLAVLPLENLSGDPNLERNAYVLLSGVSYQDTPINKERNLEKGLASLVPRHSHFAHFKRFGRQPPISKVARDQYATITRYSYVIENMAFI